MKTHQITDFNVYAGEDPDSSVYDVDVQRQQLMHVVATRKGTRVGRPNFGCLVQQFLHDPVDETTAYDIKTEIRLAFMHPDNVVTGLSITQIEVTPDYEDESFYVNIHFHSNITGETETASMILKAQR